MEAFPSHSLPSSSPELQSHPHHHHHEECTSKACQLEHDHYHHQQHDHHETTTAKQQQPTHRKKNSGCLLCSTIMIMNPFPESNNVDDYEPTKFEEAINVLTHTLPILFFAYFSYKMYEQDIINSGQELFVAIVYCVGMVILFAVSSMYHVACFLYGKNDPRVDVFRAMDYSMIYIFIGASYTPWLTLVEFGEGGWIGNVMAVAVWTIAACGLAKSFSKKFLASIDGIVLLNLMGWIAFFIIPPALFTHVPIEAFLFLFIGGIFYSGGCFLLKYGDGRVPCAHGIWHCLVNMGVMCHFLVLYEYLMNLDSHFLPGVESPLMVYQQVAAAFQNTRKWHLPKLNVLFGF
ncbi:hypothetical protein FDP41_002504 [Naegleria fowleri]|uniref:Hemolysin III n=1 Tax=Naegleria fowleri TaxID=5763 RepID=A0A6A5BWJ9_NAEFO|nr:uncharacterized protein FDP41_002504 [Naegleria fowleri]KAF0978684.1 hypothetical protein FDP41_002504 [Naegleria fowleri]